MWLLDIIIKGKIIRCECKGIICLAREKSNWIKKCSGNVEV